LSFGHEEFWYAYPHPTISPHHTHISSSSHPPSIPIPPGPSLSVPTYHQSVPAPLHQTWGFPLQPTPATFLQPTRGTFVQTTPHLIVHNASNPSVPATIGFVQGLSDHVDHGVAAALEHDLPPKEVQCDPTSRVIIRLLGRG